MVDLKIGDLFFWVKDIKKLKKVASIRPPSPSDFDGSPYYGQGDTPFLFIKMTAKDVKENCLGVFL